MCISYFIVCFFLVYQNWLLGTKIMLRNHYNLYLHNLAILFRFFFNNMYIVIILFLFILIICIFHYKQCRECVYYMCYVLVHCIFFSKHWSLEIKKFPMLSEKLYCLKNWFIILSFSFLIFSFIHLPWNICMFMLQNISFNNS